MQADTYRTQFRVPRKAVTVRHGNPTNGHACGTRSLPQATARRTSWWSCRESNPGPLTPNQAFSERSLHNAFLSLGT